MVVSVEIELPADFVQKLRDKAAKHNIPFDTFADLLLVRGFDLFGKEALEVDEFTYNWIIEWYEKLEKKLYYSNIGEFLREGIRFFLFEKKLLF